MWAAPPAVALVGALVVSAVADGYQQSIAVTAILYGIAAMSLTLLMGWVGRPSVLTASSLLAGGYCAVYLQNVLSLPFLLVLVLVTCAGLLVGAIASVPTRNLSGVYLLLSTLAMFYIISEGGNILQAKQGAYEGYYLASPSVLGLTIDTPTKWLWTAAVAALLTYMYLSYLKRSRVGRAWSAIRDNEDAARVAGVSRSRYVVAAFAISTGLQFLAGGLVGYFVGTVSYSSATLLLSVNFIVMVVIGGSTSLGGALVGSAIVVAIPPFLDSYVGGSASSSWLSQNLLPIEGIIFALLSTLVILDVPRRMRRSMMDLRRRAPAKATRREPGHDTRGLVIDDVHVSYAAGETAVLGATISLELGESVGIVGRNGAGKSSLLFAIGGFPPGSGGRVSAGRVVWSGPDRPPVDVTKLSSRERARLGISLIPAEDKVFHDLTVEEHLREALRAGRSAHRGESASIDTLWERFPSLSQKRDRRAGNLSGGERQQLAVAAALARNARLVLIDEATLGLSPIAVQDIQLVLRDLAARSGGALVLVEQDPGLAMAVSDHVVVMENGQIVRSAPASPELLRVVEETYLGLAFSDGGEPAEQREGTRT